MTDRRRTLTTWGARASPYLVPAALLLAITLPHLGQGDFRTDTGWYSAIGLSSVRHWHEAHGIGDLLTLQAEPGRPFFNKPPLALWIHGVVLHTFGVSLEAARLPTVFAACLCVLLTVGIVRRLGTGVQAMLAGAALALTIEFFRRTKEISLDMWQLVFMLAAVLVVVVAVRRARVTLRSAALSGALIGLSLLCKPLVGLLASAILASWLFMPPSPRQGRGMSSRSDDGVRAFGAHPTGPLRIIQWLAVHLACALAVATPWYVVMTAHHGDDFLTRHFVGEIAERATGAMGADVGASGGGVEPPWFYLGLIAQTYWPWLVTMICAIVAMRRREFSARARALGVLALVWFAAWLVLLSVFPDRRPRYALVLWPAGAVLSGLWLGSPAARGLRPVVQRLRKWGAPAALLGGIIFAALPVRVQRPPSPQWPELFAWMEANEVDELWQGGFSGPSGSRLYLRFGKWPIQTQDREKRIVTPPPPGAFLVYHRRDGYAPGMGEEVVFQEGDLTVARLLSSHWEPVPTPDPGEERVP